MLKYEESFEVIYLYQQDSIETQRIHYQNFSLIFLVCPADCNIDHWESISIFDWIVTLLLVLHNTSACLLSILLGKSNRFSTAHNAQIIHQFSSILYLLALQNPHFFIFTFFL